MTTSKSRKMRTRRNAMAEALGLGKAYPLRDLPVRAEPPVAAYGSIARVLVTDSEPFVAYRLLDQDAKPLPGGAAPEGIGTGDELSIDSPPIDEDISFMLEARRPSGTSAILFGLAEVRVGLDDALPLTVVPEGPVPTVVDRGGSVEIEVANSQEGVKYRLVARPDGDQAAPDDIAAMAADIPLSDGGEVAGTAAAIRLKSIALTDDLVIRVRAVKEFGGGKPPQTMLMKAVVLVFVRPDSTLGVTAKPAVVDHGEKSAVKIAKAADGIAYRLHSRPIADGEFVHFLAPGPSAIVVQTESGDVAINPPLAPAAWEEAPGFSPLGDPATGSGGVLTLPVRELVRDTMILVEARKTHKSDSGTFTSAERLDQAVAILVRPDEAPPLRLSAVIVADKLAQLAVVGGEEGVFYTLTAGNPLAEVYVHQHNWVDSSLNKGIGELQFGIDFVIASGAPGLETVLAPPPLAVADFKPVALPVDLEAAARRATTGLAAGLGKVPIASLPKAEAQPPAITAGATAKVVIAEPVAGELYFLTVDGRAVADPVPGAGAPLSLDTGPLAAGQQVELRAAADESSKSIRIERRTPIDIAIG